MFYSIGGMAIIYVLEVKDNDLPQNDEKSAEKLQDTQIPSVGLNGSDIVTTQQPSFPGFTTWRPPKKIASSPSLSPDVLSTRQSATHLRFQTNWPVKTGGPVPLNSTPKANGTRIL